MISFRDSIASRRLWPRAAFVAMSIGVAAVIHARLHASWIAWPWLAAIVAWTWRFRDGRQSATPRGVPWTGVIVVVLVSAVVRCYRFWDYPLGPFCDEVFVLFNSLRLLQAPFDLFGQTPIAPTVTDETPNLFLYFNALILRLSGPGYLGMKLCSIVPGIAACAAFYLLCRQVLRAPTALLAGLLFACAHWPLRLSRYGWSCSFMVMGFAWTVLLIVRSVRERRLLWAWLSGVVAGLTLYSYLAARVCLVSIIAFLALECLVTRSRAALARLAAFGFGAAAAAWPLACYHLQNPDVFWARAKDVTVLDAKNPFGLMVENTLGHLLMFHVRGGMFARDNYPGLPMLDPLSGALLIIGLAAALRRIRRPMSRLALTLLAVNALSGVLSLSAEGPPYVFRVAALMIPVMLLVGIGLTWASRRLAMTFGPKGAASLSLAIVTIAAMINLLFYFDLERRNFSAARAMLYEVRLIAQETSRTPLPVVLVGDQILRMRPPEPTRDEPWVRINLRPSGLTPEMTLLAVKYFSGRYDSRQSLEVNQSASHGLYQTSSAVLRDGPLPVGGPCRLIGSARERGLDMLLRNRFPKHTPQTLRDPIGRPVLLVLDL